MGNALENGREGRVSLEVGKVWIWSPFTCGVISLLEPILLSELMPICHFQKVDEHPGKNTCPPPSWSIHNSIFNSRMVLLGLFYILKLKEYEYLSRNVSNRFLWLEKRCIAPEKGQKHKKTNPSYRNLFDMFSTLFSHERQYMSFAAVAQFCIRRIQRELHCLVIPGPCLTWVLFLSS